MVKSWAAPAAGAPLQPIEIAFGPLGDTEVEIAVESCGICHSDLSMLHNSWGRSVYPLVPGHEAIGKVIARGAAVRRIEIGTRVGVGWYTGACQRCRPCIGGDLNLCRDPEETIVARHGGFAERLRCREEWAIPLPDSLDPISSGPLFCGGITVFNPFIQAEVRPTDRVGIVGIGGLGHLAVQFAAKWGCHVTAFTSTPAKAAEAKSLGAHEVISSVDPSALEALEGRFDFLLVTINVSLPWEPWLKTLAPRGRFHIVGAVLEPLAIPAFSLIGSQRTIGGSPVGAPAVVQLMLDFCARHNIRPMTETFPMAKVNDALAHLEAGKARYRVVLTPA